MDSKAILSSRYVTIGWVEQGNTSYTSLEDMQTKNSNGIANAAQGSLTRETQYALIMEKEFIKCVPNLIFGNKAQSNGVLVQTTNNCYMIVLQLLGRIPPKVMTPYSLISKEIKDY